jgi:hypothetical protein
MTKKPYGYLLFLHCENIKTTCTEELTCTYNKAIKCKTGQGRADDGQYVGCFDTREEL